MENIGRNEPCPCGSKKKYKRCCGINAEPKLGSPKPAWPPVEGLPTRPGGAIPPGAMPEGMPPMDPEMMGQLSQALSRLPKGQMQRLQALMQKAMHGKDVSREAAELEKVLPPDFQAMMKSFATQMPSPDVNPKMSEDEARRVVEAAVAEGKLTREQADDVLASQASGQASGETALSKLWRTVRGKK